MNKNFVSKILIGMASLLFAGLMANSAMALRAATYCDPGCNKGQSCVHVGLGNFQCIKGEVPTCKSDSDRPKCGLNQQCVDAPGGYYCLRNPIPTLTCKTVDCKDGYKCVDAPKSGKSVQCVPDINISLPTPVISCSTPSLVAKCNIETETCVDTATGFTCEANPVTSLAEEEVKLEVSYREECTSEGGDCSYADYMGNYCEGNARCIANYCDGNVSCALEAEKVRVQSSEAVETRSRTRSSTRTRRSTRASAPTRSSGRSR